MKKNFFLTLMLALVALFSIETATAQAPVATSTEAIIGLLNRIGGNGAADKFEIVIDASLAQDGKDVFVITSQNGKPCIKGNSQLSVATGINWYLNHYAHINLTWNKLSTDLVNASLPLPGETVTKECSADLRYYLNYCTFSYTSALWTEERWMQEIDWMALHGINMPLMLVGLDCVWYDLYTKAEYGYNYTPEEISKHIAGPAFQAWWAMINCEGHGGPNPAWWYERSRALATNMLARMRSYGMEPVLPGFCGEVPSSLKEKLNKDPEINTGGKWQGFDAPGLMGHKSTNWEKLAADYYDALEGVMGTSKYYSMDPFHEEATGLTGSSANDMKGYFQSCYAQMKANVGEGVVWVAQDWGSNPRDAMLTGLNNGELIVLDLFAEADPHYSSGYNGHDYIYCMLHNFGGRVGLHGRFNKTMDGYYAALAARGDQMVGIGATPEGVENNPMLYDMLFELPWRETAPDKTEWVNSYTVSRYGKRNETVQKAYSKLMQSVYNCTTGQQGTSEPIICAIPSLTATKVSSWASAAVDYEHEIVIAAADEMLSQVDEFDALNDNFNYDLLDVVRQALTNYALDMLAQLNSDYSANKFDATFSARKNHYLALIEDIDELLGTHQKFRLGNWAEMARAIVTEEAASRNGAGETDADWLELDNLRRQITTWAPFWSPLRDYSNREWNGLVKDYYLERWKIYFDALEAGTESSLSNDYWYNYGNTYVHDDTKTYTAAPVGDTRTVARSAFDNYFIVDTDDKSNKVYFSRHIEQSKAADEYVKYAYRGKDFTFKIPEGTTATLSIDANSDGVFGDGETVNNNTFTIPADAATTTVKAFIVLSDNTEISFYVFLADLIETDRKVTVQAGDNGSVAIEGTAESSITNSEYVTMTATAESGYEFSHWVQVAGDGTETEASRENPFIYLGKDEATFKAYFIENIWGVPSEDWGDRSDIESKQYLTSITCTQEENTTEIYSASKATAGLFVPVATMINAAKGSQFTIDWQGDGNMKNCYLSAYIDLNKDGDFDDAGELIMIKGTLGAANNSVEKGPMQVLLPYDMPTGITHIRLRFDGAWKQNYNQNTKAFPASNAINRRCYEIALNVTEHSAGNSHIVITSNNTEWGTVRNITGVTGEDINVPSGTEICMEAFPKDGYMFVHWLDKYGRVASTDASFYYTPCESGEFTAIFKEIPPETVEIDGWQIEYRTEPGKDVVTTKLAKGAKPEAGKKYYIYAPTRPTNDGEYVNRYLYNNSGSLGLGTAAGDERYMWLCEVNGENYTFKNVGDPTKYLAHKGLLTWGYDFKLGTGDTKYEGITIYSVSDGKFLVTKDDGKGFDQSDRTHNQSTEDFTTDYVFVEVSTPDVIVFTKVRQSGVNDLVIPATVEVLGEQLAIVGFDKNLFNNNTDLWSITLPSTMEFLGNNVIFETSLQGINTPTSTGDYNTDGIIQVIDLGGITLSNNEYWKVVAEYESDGSSTYNEWGTPLLEVGAHTSGSEVELFYLSSKNSWSSCWHVRAPFLNVDNRNYNDLFKSHTDGKFSKFTAIFENLGKGTAKVTVVNSEGESMTSHPSKFTTDGITTFTASLPKGVNIVNFTITKDEKVNPFSGCRNLDKIAIDGDCENYYVAQDGGLYNSSDVLVCMPEGKEKGADSRALAALIEEMKTLTSLVATYNPVGKANTALALTTKQGSAFYVSTNADQNTGGGGNDGGGIAALVDNNEGTYFHTRWGGTKVNEPHYIQVDLGAANFMDYFKFTYKPRSGSPAPTAMKVYGSNDGVNFTDVLATIDSNLPAHNSGNTYESAAIDSKRYRYLRFTVTGSAGPGNAQYGGQYFFGMLEFDLYELTSTADVYSYLEARITNEQAATAYDAMLDAQAVYDFGTTAAEMQAAKTELQSAYDTLKALLEAAIPVKLTTDEETPVLYNINFKRDDKAFLKYREDNKNVKLERESVANASYYAFYFMGTENGVTIHPYNADGKVLGASDLNNGHTKISAVEAGIENYAYEWVFVPQSDGYYNLKITKGNSSNYMSDFGNYGADTGFYGSSNSSDAGSLFKFVEAVFENDNARFYQLKDVKATMTDGTNIYGGTSVGLYTGGKEYREAYTAAAALEAAGNTSSSDDCYAAYKALRAANEVLAYNAADPGKVYYIVSAATNGYCKGQYVHTYSEVQPSHNNYDHKDLVYHNFNNIATKTLAAFQFETTNTQGEYKMKNLHTGLYVKSFGKNADHLGTEAEAQVVKIAGIADGQVTLKIGNADPMHAQDDNDCIVGWGASVGNASTWTIDEVTDLVQLNYYFTVPQDGVATLNLAFNAVLPSGVTAYDIAVDNITLNGTHYEYEATAIATAGEVLAKNTPVVVKANPGTYVFGVTLTDDGAKPSVTGSVLKGTTYKTTLAADANNYQLAVSDDQTVFNLVTAVAAATANSAWMQLAENRGAVIYDNAPVEPEVELVLPELGKVYRIKNYTEKTPAEYQYHYLANSNASIVFPTSVEATDKSAMWVCTSADEVNHKYKFVSALGTAAFGWQGVAEEALEYTISDGTIEGTVTLVSNNISLALTTEAWNNSGKAAFNQASYSAKAQDEYWSTDWYLEEVESPGVSYTASINKGNMWATMYLPYAVEIPQGVNVYYATGIADDDKTINLTQLEETIPARTAVLLHRAGNAPSTEATENFEFALAEDVEAVENLFDGTIMRAAIAAPEGTRVYLLTNYNAIEKFYWMADEYNENCELAGADAGYVKNDANRAYLKIEGANKSAFNFRIEGTTGIDEVEGENGNVKAIYDLQGRKLSEITEPGIYIIDGKKVRVK